LVGRTVTFRWDRGAGEELAEVDGDEFIERAALNALRAGEGGQGFLPPRPVEVGDRWCVDANVLIEYYEPGGDLQLADSSKRDMTRTFDLELLRAIDDELWCELVEVQHVEERELAVIRVTGEVAVQCKRDKRVSVPVFMLGLVEEDGTLDSTLELSVEGEIV
jgi:hypothetical protein